MTSNLDTNLLLLEGLLFLVRPYVLILSGIQQSQWVLNQTLPKKN